MATVLSSRPRDQYHWMATRQYLRLGNCCLYGRIGFCVPYGWWPLLLGSPAGWPSLGLGDCRLNMLGQVTITAGIDIAAAIYFVGMITQIFGIPADATMPMFGSMTNWFFYIFVMILIMIPQVLINVFGIKLTSILNDFSVYWHIGGVIIMALLLTIFGKTHIPSVLCSAERPLSIHSTPHPPLSQMERQGLP